MIHMNIMKNNEKYIDIRTNEMFYNLVKHNIAIRSLLLLHRIHVC